MKRATLLLALIWPLAGVLWPVTAAFAGPTSYACTIKSISKLNEKGELKGSSLKGSWWTFTVDRVTGRILKRPFDNSSAKIEILSGGASSSTRGSNIRILSRWPVYVDLVVIQELQEGPDKPFLVMTFGQVYSGVCR